MTPLKKAVSLAVIAGVSFTGLALTGCEPETSTKETPAVAEAPAKTLPDKPKYTVAQENAIESAQSYLYISGFSRKGLIDQLSSAYGDGFKKADAKFAVDHLHVDWNKEAVESAKSYLETGSFSRTGLIDQLSSEYGEQFTQAQAIYAVNKVGL